MKCKILIHILLHNDPGINRTCFLLRRFCYNYQTFPTLSKISGCVFLSKPITRDKILWAGDTFGSTDCGISVGCRSLRSPWFRLRVSNSLDKTFVSHLKVSHCGGDFSWICSNLKVNGWLSKFNVCYCWSFSDTQTHPDLLLLFDFFPIFLNNCSFNSFGSQLSLMFYLTHLLHTHTPVHH